MCTSIWQRLRAAWPGWETISYIAVTLALIVAFIEYRDNRAKADLDAAFNIYQEVDHAYVEYVRLCFDHPRLDCYTVASASAPTPPLSPDEQAQQRILYDMLTDVFETAYVHFVKFRDRVAGEEGEKLIDDQWETWDDYIEEFITRPAYLEVWFQVSSGYDEGLQCYMRKLIHDHVVSMKLTLSVQADLSEWLAKPIKNCPP